MSLLRNLVLFSLFLAFFVQDSQCQGYDNYTQAESNCAGKMEDSNSYYCKVTGSVHDKPSACVKTNKADLKYYCEEFVETKDVNATEHA